ncbi:MAG: hypothetical protein AAF846_05325 [Chloroflexota bacterium]
MAEIIDALRRDGDSSNTIIGIVILVLLTVFTAPDILPQLVSETIPFIEEGLPCNLLMDAQDRANHQSLIGRQTTDPLELRAEVGAYPTNGTSPLVIRVTVINNTIGTVPFVFDPNQVIVGDNPATSGLGIIFTPAASPIIDFNGDGVANQRVQQQSFNQQTLKVLGPRQRCVHRIEIPNNQLGAIQQGSQVRPYYRVTTAGVVQQTNPLATPVFGDQGLDIILGGFVQGRDVGVPFVVNATTGQ